MARIPDEAIERIKAETDLVALVQSRGIEPHKPTISLGYAKL
jgi:hypothetical protein